MTTSIEVVTCQLDEQSKIGLAGIHCLRILLISLGNSLLFGERSFASQVWKCLSAGMKVSFAL